LKMAEFIVEKVMVFPFSRNSLLAKISMNQLVNVSAVPQDEPSLVRNL